MTGGDDTQTFVAATKRELRGTDPSAVEILSNRDDVTFKGSTGNPDRVMIETTKAAAAGILEEHGDRLNLESLRPTFTAEQ